jgi:hypothetical protein
MNPPRPVIVLADDLSGAAELAGIALIQGLSAEVQTVFHPNTNADLICLDTDTRALPPDAAARTAGAMARLVCAAQPAWIFKKCDSVLRGPVLAEARAIAQAAGLSRIVVLSANPSLGRVIRGGEYFVEGRPLHQTIIARDPVHPRTTARVAELLGGPLADVETPDAESSAEVARVAAAMGEESLPVGAADFFAALLAVRAPAGPKAISRRGQISGGATGSSRPLFKSSPAAAALLVCGSAAAWPLRRAEAEKLGIPVFARPHEVTAIAHAVRAGGRALVGIGDGPATHDRAPAELMADLATTVATVLRETATARTLLEGGATARAIINALGWSRLRACEAIAPGIVALNPSGTASPLLLIKPGSYRWPDSAWP